MRLDSLATLGCFFFKQKTAYEMRISDWSSDVCSSDLFTMSYPYVSAGDALNLYFPSANRPTPNRVNWADEQTDQWLKEGRGALTPEVRAAAYAKVQKQVHDAALWLQIVHAPMFLAAGPRLKPIADPGHYGEHWNSDV